VICKVKQLDYELDISIALKMTIAQPESTSRIEIASEQSNNNLIVLLLIGQNVIEIPFTNTFKTQKAASFC